MATWQKQWHSADDISLRRQILSCIAQFVQKPGSENNMAEFVKHLETTLYHQASSREEYADLNTLRQRIFSLILRMKSSRKVEQQGPQNSYLTPKPGLSNSSTFSVGNSTSASNAAPAILNVDNPASSFAFDSRRSDPLGGYIGNTFPSINRHAASFSVPGCGFERTGQLSSNPNIPGQFSSNPKVTGQLSANPNVPGQLGSNPNVSVGGSSMIPTPGLNVETTQGISGSSVQANGCINTSNANSGIVSDYLTVENSGLVSSVSHQRDTMIDNRHQILGQDKRLFSDASQFQNTINAKPDFMQIQSQPDQQQLSYGHKNCNDFVSHTNDIVSPQLIKDGLPLPRRQMATWQNQWHSADDMSLRRQILACIAQFVQKPGSENNMAEFVKHFEMTLYLQASSREEYADLSTLRQRIFSLILRMKSTRKVEQQGPQNSYLTPKPGLSNSSTFSVGNSTSASNAAPAIPNVDNPDSVYS